MAKKTTTEKSNTQTAIAGITLPPELAAKFKLGRKATNPLVSLTHEEQMFFKVEGEMVSQESATSRCRSCPSSTCCRVRMRP